MSIRSGMFKLCLLLCSILLLVGAVSAQEPITLQFYYPVGVAGPLAQAIDGYVAEFNAAHEDIQVEPIFTGNYVENMARAQAAILSGQPPDVAILLSTDLYTLVDMEGVIPLDDYINSDMGLDIDDFFDAFMSNSTSAGMVWGIPWQRSTPILYYNKDAFAEVGLDPETPPATWDELVEFGKQLVVHDGDNVTRWGVEIPTSFWIYANFAIQAGQHIGSVEDDPCGVYLNTPEAIEALSFLRSLQVEHGIMPDGVNQWGVAPADFIAGATAMIYHSTGSLSSLLRDVPFELGTGFMPGGPAGYGANVGGGNFYIMADIGEDRQAAAWEFIRWMVRPEQIGQERQDAAWKFINWMVRPEQIGQWGIDSGYVAPRNAAWETDPLMSYAADVPQASTARHQLEFAVKEFPATLAGPEMAVITTQAVEAVYTGQLSAEEALQIAQERSDELLVQAGCELEV